jgi:large subunit ribosomal protein L17
MVTSLLDHERIETTLAKAKEVRRVAERMITLGKKGDLAALRRALAVIRKKEVVFKLFNQMAVLFAERKGGYTRILRLGKRPGDNADMALIELTERTVVKAAEKTEPKAEKKAKSPIQAARDAVSEKKAAPRKPAAAKKTVAKSASPAKGSKKPAAGKEKDAEG